MGCDWKKVAFGKTGLAVSPLGIGSSYGVSTVDVERAWDRGVNFLFYGSRRRPRFARAIKHIAGVHREKLVVATQSYSRVGMLMAPFLDKGLCDMGVDYVDLLGLGWWDAMPPRRIIDAALDLKRRGKVRHILVSCHDRPTFEVLAKEPAFDAIMVRYNAGHPGAEKDVFPQIAGTGVGVLAFTATRWGSLVDPGRTPNGEETPRGRDCYRFCLSNEHVHATLCGPRDGSELDEAMSALDAGPMTADELAWMRRVGKHIRDTPAKKATTRLVDAVRAT